MMLQREETRIAESGKRDIENLERRKAGERAPSLVIDGAYVGQDEFLDQVQPLQAPDSLRG